MVRFILHFMSKLNKELRESFRKYDNQDFLQRQAIVIVILI